MRGKKQSVEEHEINGTDQPSRLRGRKKMVKNNRYDIILKKLKETEGIINKLPVNQENVKDLIAFSNLYKKLIDILETPSLDDKPPGGGKGNNASITAKLINRKQA
jgi:hypothetical protein